MLVSSYQIHNVLNVYSKQLSQDRSVQKLKPGMTKPSSDQIKLSTEGKRKATIERVAREIINKISHYGTEGQTRPREQDAFRENAANNLESDNKTETGFVFNVIDNLNKKTKTALSVQDTKFLIDRLEQLAREAVGEDADI